MPKTNPVEQPELLSVFLLGNHKTDTQTVLVGLA